MSRVHVAVDLRILDRVGMERSGVGRYSLEIVRSLRRLRPEWELTIHSNRPDLVPEGPGIALRATRWPTSSALGRIAWLHLAAGAGRGRAPDLWLAPAFVLPARWRGPSVVTIHDLVFMLEPRLYRGRLNAWYATRAARRSARRASRVLCASAATRERIVRHLGIPAEKVVAAPWGVAEAFRADARRGGGAGEARGAGRPGGADRRDRPGGTDRPDRPGDYVLFVGRWEARKGLDVLHDALRGAARRGVRLRLVLAGGPGWGAGDTVAALRADPMVEPVVDPSDEELAALYAGALALVYPSRMEGFGFPVAEALACGCPVVASDLPELREWAGDAPLYVAAGQPGELADALLSLAADPGRREAMVERGRSIAEGLRWEVAGEAAAGAIEAALARRSASA